MNTPTPQPPIQRYELVSHGQYSMRYESLDEDPDGDWVKHDDHSRLLATLQAELAEVRKELTARISTSEESERLALRNNEGLREELAEVSGRLASQTAGHQYSAGEWTRAMLERDQALAKLAEVERERDALAIIPGMFLLDDPDAPPGWRLDMLSLCKRLRTENELRNQAIAEREAVKGDLSGLRGVTESACAMAGVDYQVHRDESAAVIARRLVEVKGLLAEALTGGHHSPVCIAGAMLNSSPCSCGWQRTKARIDAVLGRT